MKTSFSPTKKLGALALTCCLIFHVACLGQEIAGIGVALNKENASIIVKQVLPGGPAALSGHIKVGDRIIAIAQGDKPPVKTEGLDMNKIIQMIRGPKGTTVHLTVLSNETENGEPQTVHLVRDSIQAIASAIPAARSAPEKFKDGQAAPEIEGEDVDRKRFKLSDYRGKVVLLDFWGDW